MFDDARVTVPRSSDLHGGRTAAVLAGAFVPGGAR
ncbi:hypothetical protein RKD23_000726 [Streptomyces sp. SAI-170]